MFGLCIAACQQQIAARQYSQSSLNTYLTHQCCLSTAFSVSLVPASTPEVGCQPELNQHNSKNVENSVGVPILDPRIAKHVEGKGPADLCPVRSNKILSRRGTDVELCDGTELSDGFREPQPIKSSLSWESQFCQYMARVVGKTALTALVCCHVLICLC